MLLGIASKLVGTTVVLGGVLFINCCNNQLVVTNECHDLCKKKEVILLACEYSRLSEGRERNKPLRTQQAGRSAERRLYSQAMILCAVKNNNIIVELNS